MESPFERNQSWWAGGAVQDATRTAGTRPSYHHGQLIARADVFCFFLGGCLHAAAWGAHGTLQNYAKQNNQGSRTLLTREKYTESAPLAELAIDILVKPLELRELLAGLRDRTRICSARRHDEPRRARHDEPRRRNLRAALYASVRTSTTKPLESPRPCPHLTCTHGSHYYRLHLSSHPLAAAHASRYDGESPLFFFSQRIT